MIIVTYIYYFNHPELIISYSNIIIKITMPDTTRFTEKQLGGRGAVQAALQQHPARCFEGI